MQQVPDTYHKRAFWAQENLKYAEPHFRLEKAARLVNRLAGGRECDLLDVGCGPAALMRFLDRNIRYHGIDIAIHTPAPYLLQTDFLSTPIQFGATRFDIIVAQGVFEYVGSFQSQKLQEIAALLRDGGRFLVSYVNFDHRDPLIYAPYNNVQSRASFYNSLSRFFSVERVIPTSHRWRHEEPRKSFVKKLHMHININLPLVTRLLAVEYFFVCSRRGARAAHA